MTGVSRDLIHAVLQARDQRHNETHAALMAMFQALAVEMLDAGAIRAEPLAGRLEQALAAVTPEAHGATARDLLSHTLHWLRTVRPDLPAPTPPRWLPPTIGPASRCGDP